MHLCTIMSVLHYYAKSSKSPLEMNKYYTWTIDKLKKWSEDPTGLVSGTDLLWENATGSEIYLPYMTTIHERSSTSELVAEIIKGAVHTFFFFFFLCIKEFYLQTNS